MPEPTTNAAASVKAVRLVPSPQGMMRSLNLPGVMHEPSLKSQTFDGIAPKQSGDHWPILPYEFNPLKHNPVVAGAALQLLKLRTHKLKRLIFTATTGRSGTLTLCRLFSAVGGCISVHEAHPAMNGPVLRAASYGDTA